MKISIWPIDGTLTSTTIPNKSGLVNNSNEMTLCTHEIQIAQSAGTVEYTNYISAEERLPPTNALNDTKESDGTIYQPLRSGRIWHKVNF